MRVRRTTLFTAACLAALGGLGLARVSEVHFTWILTLISLLLTLLTPKKPRSIFIVIILGVSLGLWRGQHYLGHLYDLQRLSGQKVTIRARATSDAIYGKGTQLDFTAGSAKLETSGQPLAGSFKISGFGPAMVYRGDVIKISGKLRLASGTYQAYISYAQLELIEPDHSPINKLTRRFSAGMQSALPEPNASFGSGLIIGQRNNLPSDLYQQMIMVGLVHIVAVSGYNLTIIVRAAARLKLFSKYQQLALALCLIAVFILMTGFAASIVRAAIVSVLSLWAWFYGRKIPPLLILFFTAALTGLANPFYVWGDLGWYLSFLAFFGILIISPILSSRLFRRQPKLLAATAMETFCAELMALPFIMLMFGQLSLIGLVANVLVVPLVPLAMLLAATAAIAGALVPAFAGWLAWPANWLLTYMLDLVRCFASLPGIFQRRSISLAGLLTFYGLLGIILILMRRRIYTKAATITDRNEQIISHERPL